MFLIVKKPNNLKLVQRLEAQSNIRRRTLGVGTMFEKNPIKRFIDFSSRLNWTIKWVVRDSNPDPGD